MCFGWSLVGLVGIEDDSYSRGIMRCDALCEGSCRGVDVDRVDKIPDWEVRFAWRVDTCGGAVLQVPHFFNGVQEILSLVQK
jgi:hypothetical protein